MLSEVMVEILPEEIDEDQSIERTCRSTLPGQSSTLPSLRTLDLGHFESGQFDFGLLAEIELAEVEMQDWVWVGRCVCVCLVRGCLVCVCVCVFSLLRVGGSFCVYVCAGFMSCGCWFHVRMLVSRCFSPVWETSLRFRWTPNPLRWTPPLPPPPPVQNILRPPRPTSPGSLR